MRCTHGFAHSAAKSILRNGKSPPFRRRFGRLRNAPGACALPLDVEERAAPRHSVGEMGPAIGGAPPSRRRRKLPLKQESLQSRRGQPCLGKRGAVLAEGTEIF